MSERLLLDGEKPVRLGSRAMEILLALIERADQLVSKRELVSIVWPDTVVVEANLTVHLAALRRALGDGQAGNRYIINVPGRGYRWVAPIRVVEGIIPSGPAQQMPRHNLPVQIARLIGRTQTVEELLHRFLDQRLITIVGPGGIGKTVLALAVAEDLLQRFPDGVWMVDLSSIVDPDLVSTAIASALQFDVSGSAAAGLVGVLKDKEMLLVLDNCEHVIDRVADLATELLKVARNIRILATSREPLRAHGEQVYRLRGLPSPPPLDRTISAAAALAYPAVQLFAERVASAINDFELGEDDAADVGRICRELDGVPLAIEFAAARADMLGIRGIAAGLDDRLRLLAGNRRSAVARHRTIRATLDWSYQLLGEPEKTVFRRLAVFAGGFSLDSACMVVAGGSVEAADISDTIASLVLKSLIVADIGTDEVRFRWLDTTRLFALAKLSESSEDGRLALRHAQYYRDMLLEWRTAATSSSSHLSLEIANIRAAMVWAHGPRGDRSLAISLTAASAFVWLELSLLEECRNWTVKAIDLLKDSERGGPLELELQSALGLSTRYSGSADMRTQHALRTASELAEELGEHDRQLDTLSARVWFHCRALDLNGAMDVSRIAQSVAERLNDPAALNATDTMLVLSHFYAGDFATALRFAKRVQTRHVQVAQNQEMRRWGMDSPTYAKCVVAQIRWMMGFPDQAATIVKEVFEQTEAAGQPVLLSLVRSLSANLLFHTCKDRGMVKRFLSELRENAGARGLPVHEATALCLEGLMAAEDHDIDSAERLLRRGLDQMLRHGPGSSYLVYLGALAELLDCAGRPDEGLILANEALLGTADCYWQPEALRIKGTLLISAESDLDEAERLLLQAVDLSNKRSALMFELRSTVDLSRLDILKGRPGEGLSRIRAIYSRFTEGFHTADLAKARKYIT